MNKQDQIAELSQKEHDILLGIIRLQERWEEIVQPRYGVFVTTYKKLNYEEMKLTVNIQKQQTRRKEELRKAVGFFKYLKLMFKYNF